MSLSHLVLFTFCGFINVADASLDISAGWYHNCVFEPGQTFMKCFGRNDNGQCGPGLGGDKMIDMGANLPFINLGPNFVINATSPGYDHSCALSQQHAFKCWGGGSFYQLGHATADNLSASANLSAVEFRADFVPFKIAAGDHLSCVLSADPLLVCFGDNAFGQCGVGTSDAFIIGPPSNISAVDLGSNFTLVDISVISEHVCALSHQQSIKCFGYNLNGQLGYGDTTNRGLTPQSMGDGLPEINLGYNFTPMAVVAGGKHTCVLSTAKSIKCFGRNEYGQCGQTTPGPGGTNSDIGDEANEMGDNLPIINLPVGFVPIQMALGRYHTCILSEGGQVVCFGWNNRGQLGLGHTISTLGMGFNVTPVDLGTDFVPRKIVAGRDHTCAISNIDTIKCWGRNNYGQLGLGYTGTVGNEQNEMGDNLPTVDIGYIPAVSTRTPSSIPLTSASPTSASPTSGSPTSSSRSTTSDLSTASPTTTASSTEAPMSAALTTSSPTPNTPSQQASVVYATASNTNPATTATTKTNHTVTVVTLQITMPETTEEAKSESHPLLWLLYVVLCIASVCCGFSVFAIYKCIAAKRHARDDDEQLAQVEVNEIQVRPAQDSPWVTRVASQSEVEEKKDDQPETGEADLGQENSFDDNRSEGRRAASMATQHVLTAGLAEDEFEVVDDHATPACN